MNEKTEDKVRGRKRNRKWREEGKDIVRGRNRERTESRKEKDRAESEVKKKKFRGQLQNSNGREK